MFPRVVSHRLRVRSGLDDEILGSIMHPAVHNRPANQSPTERISVKVRYRELFYLLGNSSTFETSWTRAADNVIQWIDVDRR